MQQRQAILVAASVVVLLAACDNNNSSSMAPSSVPGVATAQGYSLSVFAQAPASNEKPDSIVLLGSSVYIGYQNAGDAKDGSNPSLTNEVSQYDLSGNLLKTYTVPGHIDGLLARGDLTPNQLWVMANEDGNPKLTIINLSDGSQKSYTATVNPPAHGGGYDDMQLIGSAVYVSASNPITPGAAPPTVVSLTLNPNGTTFDVAPLLAGNAMATDVTPSAGGSANPTYNTQVALSLSDPDSEATVPAIAPLFAGDLMLDSQADGKLVFIANPGTSSQSASVLTLTLYSDKDGPITPVDDTRWVPAAGSTGKTFMLFTDSHSTTYRVDGPFSPGDAFSAGQGQVMQLDSKTGHLTPFVAGVGNASALQDPHGILFVAQ